MADEMPRTTCNAPSGVPDLTCELDDDGHGLHSCRLATGGTYVWTSSAAQPGPVSDALTRFALGPTPPARLVPAPGDDQPADKTGGPDDGR